MAFQDMIDYQKVNVIANLIGVVVWLGIFIFLIVTIDRLRKRVRNLEEHIEQHCQNFKNFAFDLSHMSNNMDLIAMKVGQLKEDPPNLPGKVIQ